MAYQIADMFRLLWTCSPIELFFQKEKTPSLEVLNCPEKQTGSNKVVSFSKIGDKNDVPTHNNRHCAETYSES